VSSAEEVLGIVDLAAVMRQMDEEPLVPRDEWGDWKLDRERLVRDLHATKKNGRTFHRYEVDLERCTSSAQILDWICQAAEKAWADQDTVADLVRQEGRAMAVTINGRDASEVPPPPEEPKPKPPRATKFVQLHSDGPDSPLYALDSQGVARQLAGRVKLDDWTGKRTDERYWVPLPNQRRSE
jgi:hypothetical protein